MRLRGSGLTPPQLADQLLERRIERLGAEAPQPVVDELLAELLRTKRALRVSSVVVIVQALLLLTNAGFRLAGL